MLASDIRQKSLEMGSLLFFHNLTIFLLGGDTLVHAATDPEIEGKGGLYFENSQVYTPKYFTRVLKNQGKLWNYSCEACNIEDFFEISGKA